MAKKGFNEFSWKVMDNISFPQKMGDDKVLPDVDKTHIAQSYVNTDDSSHTLTQNKVINNILSNKIKSDSQQFTNINKTINDAVGKDINGVVQNTHRSESIYQSIQNIINRNHDHHPLVNNFSQTDQGKKYEVSSWLHHQNIETINQSLWKEFDPKPNSQLHKKDAEKPRVIVQKLVENIHINHQGSWTITQEEIKTQVESALIRALESA
ncbi:hypothetical protein [Aureibacter tunicatorum]|uniref:Uncharacterized protein n=1 Tax=Aureibacter tunicatorum TaxID=866807 RepID=A0AAE3XU01_9BACT|nr:hypothetical protein [Aureibacter tunicatorum]MDR6241965.1 hypothetical protein [Aureibacter tunicatorum]